MDLRLRPRCLGCALLAGAAIAGSGQAQSVSSLDAFGLLVAQQSRPNFAILGAGARAAGMGGAFTALADDASAASFNPAGLALLLKPEASLVLDWKEHQDRHQPFREPDDGDGFDASFASFSAIDLNFASFTMPFTAAGRNLCLQVSFQGLIDFDQRSERSLAERSADGDTVANLRQKINQDGAVSTFSLSAAYQLTQRLSLGLTAARWSGDWRFETRTEETDLASGETETLVFRQVNQWRGWNYTAGLLLRYRYLNVGASFRSGFDGPFEVDSQLAASFDTSIEPSSHRRAVLSWPSSFTLGLALKPLDTWIITGDFASFDWDDMVIRSPDDGSPALNFFDLRPLDESTTRAASQQRFGTEVTLFPRDAVLALRLGWFTFPRPELLAAGSDRARVRGITAGIGWKRGPVSLDLAYQRASSSSTILQLIEPQTLLEEGEARPTGRVESTEQRLFFTVLYQFTNRRPLQRLWHFLFIGPDEAPAEPPTAER